MKHAKRRGRRGSGFFLTRRTPTQPGASRRVAETDKPGIELSPPAEREEPGFRTVPGAGPNPASGV